ncbi:PilZ domain-containing protein, partial [Proteus terrae]
CYLYDFSDNSCAILLPDNVTLSLSQNESITLLLSQNQREHAFKANISRIDRQIIGLQLLEMTTQKAIEFTACTFER